MKNLRPDSARDRITAGKRNRKVLVERFTMTGQDEFGANIEEWVTLWGGWAGWRRASARETLAAAEVGATVTDIFDLPYTSTSKTITPLDRLVYEERTYGIEEATETGYREGMAVKASARAETAAAEAEESP